MLKGNAHLEKRKNIGHADKIQGNDFCIAIKFMGSFVSTYHLLSITHGFERKNA
jgi:hypothetical protein